MASANLKWFQVHDAQTFTLALIIISAYVVFFGFIVIFTHPIDYDGLKNITATFGIIVAGVVGYYFGNKQVETASAKAEEAKGDAEQAKELKSKIGSGYVDLYKQIEVGKKEYNELKEALENLKRDFGDT